MKLKDEMFNVVNMRTDEKGLPTWELHLNEHHYIYKAHFPGMPITPGVCIVQIVTELLSEHFECALILQVVNNIKFVSPISPTETPDINVIVSKVLEQESELTVRGMITSASGSVCVKYSFMYKKV